jgi:hypothetical protein
MSRQSAVRTFVVAVATVLSASAAGAQPLTGPSASDAGIFCSTTDLSRCHSARLELVSASGNRLNFRLLVRNLQGSYQHGMYGGSTAPQSIDNLSASHFNRFADGYGIDWSGITLATVGPLGPGSNPRATYGVLGGSYDSPFPGSQASEGIRRDVGSVLIGCDAPTFFWYLSSCLARGETGEFGVNFSFVRVSYPVGFGPDLGPPTFDDFGIGFGGEGFACSVLNAARSDVGSSSSGSGCIRTGDYVTAEGAVMLTPEPATLALLGAGLVAVGGLAARRRNTAL